MEEVHLNRTAVLLPEDWFVALHNRGIHSPGGVGAALPYLPAQLREDLSVWWTSWTRLKPWPQPHPPCHQMTLISHTSADGSVTAEAMVASVITDPSTPGLEFASCPPGIDQCHTCCFSIIFPLSVCPISPVRIAFSPAVVLSAIGLSLK